MREGDTKYDLGFCAGALLSDHFAAVLSTVSDVCELLSQKTKVDHRLLPVNSENSQKRYLSEILKRIRNVSDNVLETYHLSDTQDQKVIEFYAVLKQYKILYEFMIEKIRDKWLNLDDELHPQDFKSFLLFKLAEVNQLDQITDLTIDKLTQVALKMLKELGMYNNHRIQRIRISPSLLRLIGASGDTWFLDAMLLSEEEKQECK
jgi:hypothetical protein